MKVDAAKKAMKRKLKSIWCITGTREMLGDSISYSKAMDLLKEDQKTKLMDVRSPQEYKEGHLIGAINLPLYELECRMGEIVQNKKSTIILYCCSGHRSELGVKKLKKLGYEYVTSIAGGLDEIS